MHIGMIVLVVHLEKCFINKSQEVFYLKLAGGGFYGPGIRVAGICIISFSTLCNQITCINI